MPAIAAPPVDLSSILEAEEPIEAVLLITRTGAQLGAWTRNTVPLEVLTVMAATFLGSIETLLAALGGTSPQEVSMVVDSRRVLAAKLNAQVVIVFVAGGQMAEGDLRTAMRRIVKALPPLVSDSRGVSVGSRPRKRS